MMQTTNHPASPHDTALIADMQSVGASGHADADQVLAEILLDQGAAPPSPGFATLPWQADGVTGEWVAAADTAGDAVALYLPARLSGREEPAGLTAARLSDALRLPVLQLHYRPAPDVKDALAAYEALLGQRPASRIVVLGHSAGAALVLSALAELAAAGHPVPAAAVAISPTPGPGFALPADPAGLPPLLLACGGAEPRKDDAARFAAHADAAGAEVSLEVYEGMPHGFPLLPTEAALALFNRVAGFTADWLRGGLGTATPQPVSIRRVSWAGHVVTTEAGTRVLVDPYLSGSEGLHSGLPQSTITPAELYGCDVVAVTHAGYDHRGQAIEIVKGGRATLVSGPALSAEAAAQGIPSERLAIMVSGVEFHCRDVTITALDARHSSTMTTGGQSVSDQPMSFVLSTAAGSRIFCGGDSSLSADMKTWGELHHPQIAVLGIGGLWVGAVKVTELSPADAATAARWLGVDTVIPVHYSPGDPAPAQLTADLAAVDPSIQVAVLDFGQSWTAAVLPAAG
jgi:L-ascorbate metabolism protein UlaG (beta-lactamase superfamily)/acetyl esterase/lipase